MTTDMFIRWAVIAIILLVLLYLSHQFAKSKSQVAYLRRLDQYFLSQGHSIQLIQFGIDEYVLLFIGSAGSQIIKQGKMKDLESIPFDAQTLPIESKLPFLKYFGQLR